MPPTHRSQKDISMLVLLVGQAPPPVRKKNTLLCSEQPLIRNAPCCIIPRRRERPGLVSFFRHVASEHCPNPETPAWLANTAQTIDFRGRPMRWRGRFNLPSCTSFTWQQGCSWCSLSFRRGHPHWRRRDPSQALSTPPSLRALVQSSLLLSHRGMLHAR
jgi:hypothetical protein